MFFTSAQVLIAVEPRERLARERVLGAAQVLGRWRGVQGHAVEAAETHELAEAEQPGRGFRVTLQEGGRLQQAWAAVVGFFFFGLWAIPVEVLQRRGNEVDVAQAGGKASVGQGGRQLLEVFAEGRVLAAGQVLVQQDKTRGVAFRWRLGLLRLLAQQLGRGHLAQENGAHLGSLDRRAVGEHLGQLPAALVAVGQGQFQLFALQRLLGQGQQLQPQRLGAFPVLLSLQGQATQDLLAEAQVVQLRRHLAGQLFERRRRLFFDIQAESGLEVVEQRRLAGEQGLLLLQGVPGQGRRWGVAHAHQVLDRQQQRSLEVVFGQAQQFVVDFFHQVVQRHVARGAGSLGQLPGVVLGQGLGVARQPVHTADQTLGGNGVAALWISLQVGLETGAGLLQDGFVHMLQIDHAPFIEGVLLGQVEQGARAHVGRGFGQPGLGTVLERGKTVAGFVEAAAVEVGGGLQVAGERLGRCRVQVGRQQLAHFAGVPVAAGQQLHPGLGQGLAFFGAQWRLVELLHKSRALASELLRQRLPSPERKPFPAASLLSRRRPTACSRLSSCSVAGEGPGLGGLPVSGSSSGCAGCRR